MKRFIFGRPKHKKELSQREVDAIIRRVDGQIGKAIERLASR